MSIVSNRHRIETLHNKSKALTDQRLIKVQAKQSDTGEKDDKGNVIKAHHPNLTESKCISVPVITDDQLIESVPAMLVAIRTLAEDAQKEIAKSLILATPGLTEITSEQIAMSEVVKYLANQSSLSAELITQWFEDYFKEQAMQFCSRVCKFGADVESLNPAQLATVTQKYNGLRDIFKLFGSGKFVPESNHYTPVLAFARFIGEETDSTMQGYVAKCAKAKADAEAAMLDYENAFTE